jgi:NADH:ubiquinone oxidoreductase subunit 3 (subunit A)
MSKNVANLAGIFVFGCVVLALSYRLSILMVIPGEPQRSHALGRNGLADFQDVIYYPGQAVRAGVNPYDCGDTPLPDGGLRYRQRYPALNLFPLYSPLVLLLFAPWSFGDFTTSAITFVIFNLLLILGFAYLCFRTARVNPSTAQVTLLASVMLATQAGRANFLGGDTGLILATASLAAVWLAPKYPWLAGWALAITSFKPTFGLPLGILLLASGYFRTVLWGWSLGFIIAVAGLLVIFNNSGDLARLPEILKQNQEVLESDPDVNSLSSAIRIDSASALVRLSPWEGPGVSLLATLLVLSIASWSLWKLRHVRTQPLAQTLIIAIVALTTVSSMYHITYDALLAWGSIACIWFTPNSLWPAEFHRRRLILTGLLCVPMINFLGTKTVATGFLDWFPVFASLPSYCHTLSWTFVCTVNGLSHLAALLILAQLAHQTAQSLPTTSEASAA